MQVYHTGTALSRFQDMLPYHVLATDDFSKGAYSQPLTTAVRLRDIAPDPEGWITAVRIDVDHNDAATRWMDANLPQPSLVIQKPSNGHAHYVWLLSRWVRSDNVKAVRYLKAVRAALTEAVNADRAYAGTFMHNPLCGAFRVLDGPAEYALSDLAQYVDLHQSKADKSATYQELYRDGGRNCGLFEAGRKFAYGIVRGHRCSDDRAGFSTRVEAFIGTENATLANPLSAGEVRTIARSITRWTWARYAKVTPLRRRKRYAQDRAAYLKQTSARRSAAMRLAAEGQSTATIAAMLRVSQRSVRRYLECGDAAHEAAA